MQPQLQLSRGPSMSLTAQLKGHKASVCCVKLLEEEQVAISGAEDGCVCTFDLRINQLTSRIRVASQDAAVPSVAVSSAASMRLYCCSDTLVQCLDLRKAANGCFLQTFDFSSEEVNCIAINSKGTLLAASDDAGQTAIIDLSTGSLTKMLRGGHTNIASSVTFRQLRPWEVLTGGLDAQIVRWDFSSGRPTRRWDLGRAEGQAPQVCNPPLVHAVAAPIGSDRTFGRVMAAACGNGAVSVYDAEPEKNAGQARSARSASSLPSQPLYTVQEHSSAANCVAFPVSGKGRLVASGGNDGKIVVRDWTQHLPTDSQFAVKGDSPAFSDLRVQHGKKVNGLDVFSTSLEKLLVADTSRAISVYTLL